MNGLSCGEEIMTRRSAVLIGCQRVTDRQTYVQPISITCFSIADARKNKNITFHPLMHANVRRTIFTKFCTVIEVVRAIILGLKRFWVPFIVSPLGGVENFAENAPIEVNC